MSETSKLIATLRHNNMRIAVLEYEVDMWRKHVVELEATIRRIEALFSEIEKIEAAGDDIHTPWLVIMFEEALGEAK